MQELPSVCFEDLGSRDYKEAWDYQISVHKSLVEEKRKKADIKKITQKHHLLFCEHLPVYTLGKSGSMDHLLMNKSQLEKASIDFYKINRGGDITYHGPGQLTVYPIFDLDEFFTDVHKYVRFLEEVVIRTLADFRIVGTRFTGYTGVWVQDPENAEMRKICAIGVHVSRWVTMHGLALNVNTQLKYFSNIIPCGIELEHTSVSSMQKELRQAVNMELVKTQLKFHFSKLFEFEFI